MILCVIGMVCVVLGGGLMMTSIYLSGEYGKTESTYRMLLIGAVLFILSAIITAVMYLYTTVVYNVDL